MSITGVPSKTSIGPTLFGVASASAEEHTANYQTARAFMGKGVTRLKERSGFPRTAPRSSR